MTTKPKQYRIDTLEKLLNAVNESNSENLAVDLASWIMWYGNVISETRKTHPKETEGKTNVEIANAAFIWTDDKKTGVVGVVIEDPNTGEITEIS
jgi:hypothetical protein